jgi:selenide,water dikinase
MDSKSPSAKSEAKPRLTDLVAASGCAAKLGPRELRVLLGQLVACDDERLLVGAETMDDAAVIRLGDDTAICFTTDFITPLVDDPFDWGRIAATNAISDVYAMGGQPLAALNLVCWNTCLPAEMLARLLAGGAEAARAAGCMIVGGHSVQAKEPKYGMAVIGTVHPDRVVRNRGARPGDALYLTKPLGVGVLCTAFKAQQASEAEYQAAVRAMTTLNRDAAAQALQASVNAMTDVTGFGLAGHLMEMLGDDSGLGVTLQAAALPLLPGFARHVATGLVPGGGARNRDAFAERVTFDASVEEVLRVLLFDPQTSGGLLLAIPPQYAEAFAGAAAGLDFGAVRIGSFDRSGRVCVAGPQA